MVKVLGRYLLILLGTATLQAQNFPYKIKGKITDENRNIITDVIVEVKGNGKIRAITNEKGFYNLAVPIPKVTLRIYKMGFVEKTVEVSVSSNENRVTYLDAILFRNEIELQEVVVTDNPSLVTNSKSAIQKNLNRIPGGVILTDLSALKTQRSQTLKDAIGNEPGVIIQEFFGGNDQPRLNIRGSGIQSNPQSRGVALLQDGIPINFADGSYIIGVLEPQASHLVEVYKGANALQYGSATLGGAINFVTKNGFNASPFAVKLEKGSFEYFNSSLSSGLNVGNKDIFVSTSYNQSNGFRTYNSSKRYNALLNMGYRFSDNFEARILANYTNLAFDVSGPITKAQMYADPKQVNGKPTPKNLGPNVLRDNPNRASEIFRIGNKNTLKVGDKASFHSVMYYQYADDVFTFPISGNIRQNFNNDFGGNIVFEHKSNKNHFSIGGSLHYGKTNQTYFINRLGSKSIIFANNDLEAFSKTLYFNEVHSLTSELDLVASLQTSWDLRKITDRKDNPNQRPSFSFQTNKMTMNPSKAIDKQHNFFGLNPKIGLVFSLSKTVQTYANFSRSYEPPTFLELINLSGGSINSSPTKIESSDLSEQTASIIEIGSRGQIGNRLQWNISLYHSWIKGELLTITDLVGISGNTINSPSKTIHQGAEIGFISHIWNGIVENKDYLQVGATYNFSNFYFKEGLYKDKQIAGIPRHYLIGKMEYKHSSGILLNINTESSLEKTYTNHMNELYQDPFTLINARIGFQCHKWGIFVDARNLADKIYASSYLVRDKIVVPPPMKAQGATIDSFTNYIPGMGRNIVVGFNYNF